jgi:hypothetical protein
MLLEMDDPHGAHVNPRGHDVNLRSGPQMREYERIVGEIQADGPRRILDWGCGYGQVSDLLHGPDLRSPRSTTRPTWGSASGRSSAIPI